MQLLCKPFLFFLDINMPKVVIIQGSLNPKSKTAIVAQEAEKILHRFDGIVCQILDLRYFEIQFCDGRKLQDYGSDTKKAYEMAVSYTHLTLPTKA